MPRVLLVAGHDPTQGAGIDADRQAVEAHGAEAVTVVTALTDQDGERVHGLGGRDPGAWLAEARAVLTPAPDALKSGLLPGADHVRALARLLDELHPAIPVVVDPVLAASGGEVFLDGPGIEVLLAEVIPRGVALTPNLPEAARLTGLPEEHLQEDLEARVEAAARLIRLGASLVCLKGGHGHEDPVQDLVLAAGEPPAWAEHPRLAGRSLHGSGCRFAAALATLLAGGAGPLEAAREAGTWVAGLLAREGSTLGAGSKPR